MTGNLAILILIVFVLLALGWLILRLLSRSYIKTTAATAFVRTGGLRGARAARPTVVVNGAAWVFGFLHRIKWVSLETMAIEVHHLDEDALITNDPQYVDLEARFFIRVGDDPQSISLAARTIGGEMVDEARVRRFVEPKINGAVRDVAVAFASKELLEKRADFVRAVRERLQQDLAENGLVLESVSILTLRPTLQGRFSTEDVLGAQVARANAAVIEQALTEKNRLEKMGALERARQNASAEREQLGIEEEIERERAGRTKNIATVRAAEEAAARVTQEEKRQEAERARILAERALQEERLANERAEALLREQLEQAIALERVLRDQAIALAEEERQKRIAEATAEKLVAARRQIEADREREQALQEALTAAEKAAAEREAEIELINARLEAEKQAIEIKNALELELLQLRERTEAERATAAIQAETLRVRAEAELDAAQKAAVGERERASAAGLAEVQVALERVAVLHKEAEALRQKLIAEAEGEKARAEALASQGGVVQELELSRLNLGALKDIEIARARSLGEAISGMKMHVIGDSAMAHRLLQLVTAAQSAEHIYSALPPSARTTLEGFADRLNLPRGVSHNGAQRVGKLLDLLIAALRKHYPGAFDENPTLGALAETLRDADDSAIYQTLPALIENLGLQDLSLNTVLTLARDWLGWQERPAD